MSEPGSGRDGEQSQYGRHHGPLTIRLGPDELVVQRRYEAASVVNDILIALWFIAGSIMFFSEAWLTAGTWCFLLGSAELLIRPAIRLSRQIHLQRLHGGATRHASSQDF
jgi:hypothetical protein